MITKRRHLLITCSCILYLCMYLSNNDNIWCVFGHSNVYAARPFHQPWLNTLKMNIFRIVCMYMSSFLNKDHIWQMNRKHIVKHRLSIKCNIITLVISKKRNVNIAECSQIKCMVYYADHEVIKEEVEVSIRKWNFNKYP